MKKHFKYLAIVLALLLSFSTVFFACKKNHGKNDNTTEITTLSIDDYSETDTTATDETQVTNELPSGSGTSKFVPDSSSTKQTQNAERLLDGYKYISSSKNLLIKYNFYDSGSQTSVIGAIDSSNGDTYIRSTVSSGLDYAILITKAASYFMLPSAKEYAVIPESSNYTFKDNAKASVTFMRDMLYLNPDNMTFIESVQGTENGKRLTRETYETTYTNSDGVKEKTQNQYFFSGKTLVKVTNVSAGQTIYIDQISTNVDSSIFNVPSGWTKVEFTDIISHMLSSAS